MVCFLKMWTWIVFNIRMIDVNSLLLQVTQLNTNRSFVVPDWPTSWNDWISLGGIFVLWSWRKRKEKKIESDISKTFLQLFHPDRVCGCSCSVSFRRLSRLPPPFLLPWHLSLPDIRGDACMCVSCGASIAESAVFHYQKWIPINGTIQLLPVFEKLFSGLNLTYLHYLIC